MQFGIPLRISGCPHEKSHIIAIVIIAVAIAAILSTVADSSTYASFSIAADHPNKTYHVVGKLAKEKPQEYNPQANADLFTFSGR